MGWQTGTGLGVSGEGIVTPIESKLRPKNIGIAFKGFKEKTRTPAQDKEEADAAISVEARQVKEKKSEAWRKPRKVKTKIEYKTYEEIIAETAPEVAPLPEVVVASWTPSTDPTRIPEVRHNLRLITEACKTNLDGLAREAKALEDRKRFIAQERARLRKEVTDESEIISRFQKITLAVDEIRTKSTELSSMYEVDLDNFSPLFSKLLAEFPIEFDKYRLDEIIVAAIVPVIRRKVAQWNPLQDPFGLVSTFQTWKKALKVNTTDASQELVPMTPYESLLWNIWLPKVRTCINNEWNPDEPAPAVKFYETWAPFLPPFVRDNLLDQLILPKVSKAVSDWNPKRTSVALHTLIFPWLPHLGLRVEDVFDNARRKLRSSLRSWAPAVGVPKDLSVWREVFTKADWDALLLKYIIPKLGSLLREEFRVNPRNQDMEPLKQVLPWSTLIRPSIFSQLLETEFFPKWLDILHMWLIQPSVNFGEVAEWYSFWKKTFPEDVQNMAGVARGFTRGLHLMNTAIALGPDAPVKLKRPDWQAELVAASATTAKAVVHPKTASSRTQEITFRAIVEEYAAEHNLLFLPSGKVHEKLQMPLFRVSNASGKGGVLVYVQDHAVWASDGDEYRAITLEEMVLRVNK
ncbi:GC-rich sequence DNA-binding factor-like protein-domain-containing protein [Scleroderma citrinum]